MSGKRLRVKIRRARSRTARRLARQTFAERPYLFFAIGEVVEQIATIQEESR